MIRACSCCRTPLRIAECQNARPMVYDFLYAIIAECPRCMSTQAWVLWELPDEMLDEREEEAA